MVQYNEGKTVMPRKHIRIILLALAISILAFVISYKAGIAIVTEHVRDTGFTKHEEGQYVDSLQKYVTQYDVAASDLELINVWAKKNPDIAIMLYDKKKDVFQFISQYYVQGQDVPHFKSSDRTYNVSFADGTCEVLVTRVYNYILYYIDAFIAMFIGLATFFTVFFVSINRRTKYIIQLSDEMELLGSGNLNYEITVKGNDELTYLADNLNQMRLVLLKLIDEEEHLAHDIKTPLTSIMLFAELLEQGKYENEEQKNKYIERIRTGATHINEITEQLMQHTHNGEKPVTGSVKPTDAVANGTVKSTKIDAVNLKDMLDETFESLRLSGFTVQESFGNADDDGSYDTAYGIEAAGSSVIVLTRIMENIRSNIIKYADTDYPLQIRMHTEGKTSSGGKFVVEFHNTSKPKEQMEASGGIGLKSVNALMQTLGGEVQAKTDGAHFVTRLIFSVQ